MVVVRAMREAEELVLEIPEPRVLGAHGVFLLGVPPGGGEIVLCASAGASIGHSMPGNSHMPSVTSAAVAAERNRIEHNIASASHTAA